MWSAIMQQTTSPEVSDLTAFKQVQVERTYWLPVSKILQNMFVCVQRKIIKHFSVSKRWVNFHFWVNYPLSITLNKRPTIKH